MLNMNDFKLFSDLHRQQKPLVLGNVWDVTSANACQDAEYSALGTSSAAIATSLGYQDGEEMSFGELLRVVRDIKRATNIPLSVDLEAGYGLEPADIINNIMSLTQIGIVGINLEDSIVVDGLRTLLPRDEFAKKLGEISNIIKKKNIDIFLNIRTDTYLLKVEDILTQTLERIRLYTKNGASGIFIPGLVIEDDIQEICSQCTLPVNVMCMPGLPDFDRLTGLGVKRISMGNFVYDKMARDLRDTLNSILTSDGFQTIFER